MKTYFHSHLKQALSEYLDKHEVEPVIRHEGENKDNLTRALREFKEEYKLVNSAWLSRLTGISAPKIHEVLKRKVK